MISSPSISNRFSGDHKSSGDCFFLFQFQVSKMVKRFGLWSGRRFCFWFYSCIEKKVCRSSWRIVFGSNPDDGDAVEPMVALLTVVSSPANHSQNPAVSLSSSLSLSLLAYKQPEHHRASWLSSSFVESNKHAGNFSAKHTHRTQNTYTNSLLFFSPLFLPSSHHRSSSSFHPIDPSHSASPNPPCTSSVKKPEPTIYLHPLLPLPLGHATRSSSR